MGNNPSKGPSGDVPAGHAHLSSTGDHKVARRPSLGAIPTSKATAANPSASKATAAGHSATSQGFVQHRLQSRNVPDSPTRGGNQPGKSDARRVEYTESKEIPPPDHSNPVQVPISRHAAGLDPIAPSGPPLTSYYNASHLQRPPRMPLPIGDANTTPGSPIVGPEDSHIQSLPADRLLDEQMRQGITTLSSTTFDGEELVDELQPYTVSGVGKAIPTLIEWTGPGQKVYVTGTFVNWEKKFRLHRRYAFFPFCVILFR